MKMYTFFYALVLFSISSTFAGKDLTHLEKLIVATAKGTKEPETLFKQFTSALTHDEYSCQDKLSLFTSMKSHEYSYPIRQILKSFETYNPNQYAMFNKAYEFGNLHGTMVVMGNCES